mmetsp:Transcript_26928/g.78109  ORF Transcript_26928/g.78109 Transcript_26928/m.78109 type:complete len:83 (+) Transcript_26928:81-329(+)
MPMTAGASSASAAVLEVSTPMSALQRRRATFARGPLALSCESAPPVQIVCFDEITAQEWRQLEKTGETIAGGTSCKTLFEMA